jgi:hypothetical protein
MRVSDVVIHFYYDITYGCVVVGRRGVVVTVGATSGVVVGATTPLVVVDEVRAVVRAVVAAPARPVVMVDLCSIESRRSKE